MKQLLLGGVNGGQEKLAYQSAQHWAAQHQQPLLCYQYQCLPDNAATSWLGASSRLDAEPFAFDQIHVFSQTEELLALFANSPEQFVVIDGMSYWLADRLANAEEIAVQLEIAQILQALKEREQYLVISYEIGQSIVPLSASARGFVDQLGAFNQAIAALSEQVALVIAGLPLMIKGTTPFES